MSDHHAASESENELNTLPKTSPNRSSQLRRLLRLAKKELVEILRDRRTIITLVLMPLLVYPLMGVVVQKLLLQSLAGNQQIIYNVGFRSEEEAKEFAQLYWIGEHAVRVADGLASDEPAQPAPTSLAELKPGQPNAPTIKPVFLDGPLADFVKHQQIDIGILIHRDQTARSRFEILHDAKSQYSYDAMQHVGRRLRLAGSQFYSQFLAQGGLPPNLPGSYVESRVEAPPVRPALLTFVPLMLVLMTITGAVYPAIDMTAGERERGTMEILVAAPISRLSVLIGKFVAVFAVAILTAIANLIAMMVTVYTLGLDSLIFGEAGLALSTIGIIFILLAVLAAFFSAVLLGLTSFARSFKEAQAYLIPLMLVAFAPGLLSLTPNLETTNFLAVVPLVNIVLVGRDLLAGQAAAIPFAVTIISTLIYGLLALSFASRVFGEDSILTGGKSSWADFFDFSGQQRSVPEISSATGFLAVLFPAFIVASGLVTNFGSKAGASVGTLLWCNATITVLLFVGLPFLFAKIGRFKPQTTFFFKRPPILAVLAAILLGLAVWTLAYELEIASLSSSRMQEFIKLFESMKVSLNSIPLPVKLICLALVPAVCEEITFRGFLLSAFLERVHVVIAIIVTALLFGLFHIFVRDFLMFERMIPSSLLGLLLGYVCVRSGSIIPGILLHVVHNGLLITMAHYEDWLLQWGIGVNEQEHLPIMWLAIAIVPIIAGFLLLQYCKRDQKSQQQAASSF